MSGYDRLARVYDRLFAEPYYRDYERFILRACPLRSGRALDVACGTGRLGARLRRRGFEVTGVDRSAGMLARARRRGLRVVRGAIESFRVREPFELAVCSFDSLNHLKSLGNAFRRVSRALRPGGFFIFDLNTPFKINQVCPSYRGRRFRAGPYEIFWLNETSPDRWTSRIVMFGRDGARFEETIHERCFSRRQVESRLASAGLKIAGVYSDLRFRPVAPTRERWYYVTSKQ